MEEAIMTSQQENRWIEMAQMGDLSAFNELVLAHQDLLFRMALWMLNDENGAADITQTVFLAAYRGMRNFRGGSLRCWLLKMVRNSCIDELRRRKRHPWLSLEPLNKNGEEIESARWLIDPGASPEEALIQHETRERVEYGLRRLPETMREIVVLIDIEEWDYAEVSTALGIPLGTVKSRLGRARARLREILRGKQQEPRFFREIDPKGFPC